MSKTLNDLTTLQLRQVIKAYNLHTRITGYHKLKKSDLIKEMEKHIQIINNKIYIKHNKSELLPKKPKGKEKNKFDLLKESIKLKARYENLKQALEKETNKIKIKTITENMKLIKDDYLNIVKKYKKLDKPTVKQSVKQAVKQAVNLRERLDMLNRERHSRRVAISNRKEKAKNIMDKLDKHFINSKIKSNIDNDFHYVLFDSKAKKEEDINIKGKIAKYKCKLYNNTLNFIKDNAPASIFKFNKESQESQSKITYDFNENLKYLKKGKKLNNTLYENKAKYFKDEIKEKSRLFPRMINSYIFNKNKDNIIGECKILIDEEKFIFIDSIFTNENFRKNGFSYQLLDMVMGYLSEEKSFNKKYQILNVDFEFIIGVRNDEDEEENKKEEEKEEDNYQNLDWNYEEGAIVVHIVNKIANLYGFENKFITDILDNHTTGKNKIINFQTLMEESMEQDDNQIVKWEK